MPRPDRFAFLRPFQVACCSGAAALLFTTTTLILPTAGCTSEPEPEPESDAGAGADAGQPEPSPAPEPGPPPIDAGPVVGPVVVNTDNGDGTTNSLIAAIGRDPVYFSFADQAEVTLDDPLTSSDWDLGFLRFNIGVNGGGYFGNAGGGVLPLAPEVLFDDVTAAPADGYLTDLEDDDLDGNPEFIMGDEDINPWYAYDEVTHVLTATGQVYVIRTDHSGYYALTIEGYYNDDGAAGYVDMHWKSVDAPTSGDAGPGPTDAGPTDAGPTDAGPTDAGPTDAGVTDAGATDAGPTDAGTTDAG